MNEFWACNDNKVKLQQFFIHWLKSTYHNEKQVYLGGSHEGNIYECHLLQHGVSQTVEELKCKHEEANERIQYHLNHLVCNNIHNILVSSGDTDVFVSLMFNFLSWRCKGLEELWVEHNGKISSISQSVEAFPRDVVLLLPALHSLTGCDVTSKVGTKHNAVKAAHEITHYNLLTFGVDELNEEMIKSAESFLVASLPYNTKGMSTFDEVRHSQYHKTNIKDLSNFPCTSSSLRTHIKRAYLQTHVIIHAATSSENILDETLYGYSRYEDGCIIQ